MPKVRLMTKRLIGGVFFGFALAWLFVIGYAERYSEGERLWLFGATHDAGKVQRGSVLEHSPYPKMILDTNDLRLMQLEVCRIVPRSFTIFLTNNLGVSLSDPIRLIPSELQDENIVVPQICAVDEDCNEAIVRFVGKAQIHGIPDSFVLLAGADTNDSNAVVYLETVPFPLVQKNIDKSSESIFKEILSSGRHRRCTPRRERPCNRPCEWRPRIRRNPNSCIGFNFSDLCAVLGSPCASAWNGYAGAYMYGDARAVDDCVGCTAIADCLIVGYVIGELIHISYCPCRWQFVEAEAVPIFYAKANKSGSYGFGGDVKAIAAGVMIVEVFGGCTARAQALCGCQVGHDSPVNVTIGFGRNNEGYSGEVQITISAHGRDTDSCFGCDVTGCRDKGNYIKAIVSSGMKLLALANAGIMNALPVWAEAQIYDSEPNTKISGVCEKGGGELKIR